MTGHEVIIEFELKDEKITNSTDKIIEAFQEIKSSFSGNVDKPISQGLADMASESKKAAKPLKEIKKSAKGAALVMGVLATKAGIYTKKAIQLAQGSAEFIGTQTKFNAIFDRTNGELEEAQKWVDNYAKSLMLDNKAVMDAVSNFKLFANTLGLSNEKAKEITFNMTQLAHDMAAVAGVDVSTMAQKINSALAGQTKALKEYGISLDSNSLQQTLYQNNIKRTVASLNSAEKAELIYTQIMKQTAGQQGYLAKTMLSPANAANIVKTQFTLLGRSIGNLVLPILMKLLPVVVAVTQALTRMAEALAAFFRIKINFSDYGADIGGISAGIDGIGESADGASKKIKNMLRDFDDLHVVDFGDDSGSGGGIGGGIGGGGLGLEAQQYADWSKYITDDLEKVKEKVHDLLPIIFGVSTALLGWKIANTLFPDIFKAMSLLKKMRMLGGTIAVVVGISTVISGIATDDLKQHLLGSLETGLGIGLLKKSAKAGVFASALTLEISLAISMGKWVIDNFADLKEQLYSGVENLNLGQIINVAMNSIGKGAIDAIGKLFGVEEFANNGFQDFIKMWQDYFTDVKIGYNNWKIDMQTAFLNFKDDAVEWTKQTKEGMETKWNEFKQNFNVFKSIWEEKVAPWFTKEKWIQLANNGKQGLETKWNEFKQNFNPFANWWNEKVAPWFTWQKWSSITNNAKQGVETKWNEFKNNFNPFRDFWNTKVAPWFTWQKWRDLASNATEGIKSAFSSLNIKIKLPHFTWTSKPATGWIKNVLSALSLPTSLPKLNVSWYAGGGFPDKGDLFIANEREPELIGTMGNKTTVANSVQIIEGIASASYTGMKRALQEVDWGSGDTLVYVGNKQLTDVVTKQQNFNSKKYGR